MITFDMAAFEADRALLRRSSSLVPHTGDHPHKPLSREHGLMSWPENFYKSKLHQRNLISGVASSLPARAMQLSIFGSMVWLIYFFCLLGFVWKHPTLDFFNLPIFFRF